MVKGRAALAGGGLFALPGLARPVPVLVEEVWVQCDAPGCKKWRKLPPGSKAPPDNAEWFCAMNTDPYRNSCDIPEEDYDDEEDWEAKEEQRRRAAQLGAPAHGSKAKKQQQQQQQQQQYGQQPYWDAGGGSGAARRRRSAGELYAAADYEWGDKWASKKRKRKSAGPPQQLPHFFGSLDEEQQQLVAACQRVLDNGGLWDPAASSALAASGAGPSPGQLALPVWVWNGLHAHAPDAAALLVRALDALTSAASLDMQAAPAPAPAPAGGAGEQQQQQQQQQQSAGGAPPDAQAPPDTQAPPDQQQQQQPLLSVLEQRWRFARVALLAAAAAALAELQPDAARARTQAAVAAAAAAGAAAVTPFAAAGAQEAAAAAPPPTPAATPAALESPQATLQARMLAQAAAVAAAAAAQAGGALLRSPSPGLQGTGVRGASPAAGAQQHGGLAALLAQSAEQPAAGRRAAMIALLALLLAGLASAATPDAPKSAAAWPACAAAAGQGATPARAGPASGGGLARLDVPVAPGGCYLAVAHADDAAARNGGLLLAGEAVVAGVYDGALGRPPAVELRAAVPGDPAPALLLPRGGALVLQDLLLVNASLTPPDGNPSLALLPRALAPLPPGASLRLRDVQALAHLAFLLAVPAATLLSDNTSFVHLRNFSAPPFGVVEARALTLLAPAAARVGAGDAAGGDAAGIVTVTDSYVLAATNATLVPLLRRLAGAPSASPLLVALAANASLAPRFAPPGAWPPGGLVVARPLVLLGSSWRVTSLDLGMQVGQVQLSGRWANATLLSLALENLAYGDEASSQQAEGNSILLSNQLWAFAYKRAAPRLVLHDVVLVLPEARQIESIVYWINAFNSDLPFWRQQTAFLRDALRYTVIRVSAGGATARPAPRARAALRWGGARPAAAARARQPRAAAQYTRGRVPGDYVILEASKKDQVCVAAPHISSAARRGRRRRHRACCALGDRVPDTAAAALCRAAQYVCNVTYTTRPAAAHALPLPFNASLHQPLLEGQADPAVGAVYTLEDLVITLWNQRRSACSRDHILLPGPGPGPRPPARAGAAPPAPVTCWAPAPLSFAQYFPPAPSPPPPGGGAGAGAGVGAPPPLPSPPPDTEAADPAEGLPAAWPAPGGGVLVRCPVQLRGAGAGAPPLVIDAAHTADVFRVVDAPPPPPLGPGGTGELPVRPAGAALLQLSGLTLGALPQGGGLAAAAVPATGPAAVPAGGAGGAAAGAAWLARAPAEAWTHLVWSVRRNLTADHAAVALINVTLLLPPGEAEQLVAAAASALAAAGGNASAALLSVLYPSAAGTLPAAYRGLLLPRGGGGGGGPGGSASRRRLRQEGGGGGGAGEATLPALCFDSMEGLGLTGRNVCVAPQPPGAALPPDYAWPAPEGGAGGSGAWPPWRAVVAALAVAVPLAAAALWVAGRRHRRRREAAALEARPGGSSSSKGAWSGGRDARGKPARRWGHAAVAAWSEQSPPDGSGGEGGCGTRSSENLRAYAAALAAKLVDCCNDTPLGSTAGGTGGLTAGGTSGLATGTPGGSSAGGASGGGPGARAGGLASGGGSCAASVVVDLGEDLGRLAAAHRRQHGGLGGAAAADDDDEQGAEAPRRPGQGGLPHAQAGAGAGAPAAPAAAEACPAQRLSLAISAVSADMLARRLAGSRAGPAPGAAHASAGSSPRPLSCLSTRSPPPVSRLSASPAGAPRRLSSGLRQLAEEGEEEGDEEEAAVAATGRPGGSPRWLQRTPSSPGSSAAGAAAAAAASGLQLHEVVGSGAFGIVWRATWRGIPAAVKVVTLPANGGAGGGSGGAERRGSSRRERMAVMETALAASLSHPNIVYTYLLRPLGPPAPPSPSAGAGAGTLCGSDGSGGSGSCGGGGGGGALGDRRGSGSGTGLPVTGWEVQLVMEFCPLGSLRAAIDGRLLDDRVSGTVHHGTCLGLALGVARAVHHLHSEGERAAVALCRAAANVLLKQELMMPAPGAGAHCAAGHAVAGMREELVAKVADFGLAVRLDDADTHVSGVHRGTLSHMAPELLLHGRASRASDVYAFGILLYELATGLRAFADVPKAMLGAAVVRDRARPEWPEGGRGLALAAAVAAAAVAAAGLAPGQELRPPISYRQLAEACWAHEPQDRPTFAEVCAALEELQAQEQARQARLAAALAAPQRQRDPAPAPAFAAPPELRPALGAAAAAAALGPSTPRGAGRTVSFKTPREEEAEGSDCSRASSAGRPVRAGSGGLPARRGRERTRRGHGGGGDGGGARVRGVLRAGAPGDEAQRELGAAAGAGSSPAAPGGAAAAPPAARSPFELLRDAAWSTDGSGAAAPPARP
ncbi:BAK1 [Scenedesmus sp. PABB004]|nr:BAK1 [Scenedesmus sp. PABB004]